MQTLQDRLKLFITTIDSSVLSFENKCGMAPGTVNKMSDNSRPKTLEKIHKQFPQLNMDWLKTGEGDMLNPDYHGNLTVGSGIGVQGNVGRDVTQMTNSEKLLADFISGIKSQNKIIEKLVEQNDKAMDQTNRAMSQTDKLITIIQNNFNK